MPKAKINGIELYYEVHGDGYPIACLHGFTATAAMWQPQVIPFSKKYKLIIYDARGHGKSESPPSLSDYSTEIAVEDLNQLLSRLHIEKAVIMGLSMGGYVSLNFCLSHPEKVAALILAGTGPGFRSKVKLQQWNEQMETIAKALETKGLAALNEEYIASSIGRPPGEETSKLFRHSSPIGLINTAHSMLSNVGVIERLPEIKVPTLIIVGEHDTNFMQASLYLNASIKDSERVVVPDAGHVMNMDQPELFNNAVLQFLKSKGLP